MAINETGMYLPDDGQFAFSFFSHGRCMVPQRWGLRKDRWLAGDEVKIHNTTDSRFIDLGSFGFFTFAKGSFESSVDSPRKSFEGIDDKVLTGKNFSCFTTARLLVVRLE